MSWIENEISWKHQATPYREKEMLEPLYIHPEVHNSRRTFYDCILVTNNVGGVEKINPIREEAFLD